MKGSIMDRKTLGRFAMGPAIALVLASVAIWRDAMSPGIAAFLLTTVLWVLIRTHFEGDPLPVAVRHRESRETWLVRLVGVGLIYLPCLAIVTPLLDFAFFPAPLWRLGPGAGLALLGLWLFWRSHADLGRNWSPVLELRDSHSLVTTGVYRTIRHPMYSAIFLLAVAQAIFLANWIVGPAGLLAFSVLYLDRVKPEEDMMATRFGPAWTQYAARTGRLWPAGRRKDDPHAT